MEEYLKAFKNKKRSTPIIKKETNYNINYKNIITKVLLSTIFVLSSLIFTKVNDDCLFMYKEYVLTESLPFTKVKGWYEDLFGEVLPKDDNTQTVFNGKLVYKSIEKYLDGNKLTVSTNSLVNNITSGIVVYVGEKEDYGNTVIIQGIDGADIWYGNLSNISVKLYDYLETEQVLGEVNGEELYLVIKKDNSFLDYEEYKS